MLGAKITDPTTNDAPLTRCIIEVYSVHKPAKNAIVESTYSPYPVRDARLLIRSIQSRLAMTGSISATGVFEELMG